MKSASGSHELRGSTLGIIGYGRIGSQVSVLAETLGMNVLFYDVGKRLSLGNAKQVDTMDELLTRSDVVTLHIPGENTELLIGEKELSRMKSGSALLNNARCVCLLFLSLFAFLAFLVFFLFFSLFFFVFSLCFFIHFDPFFFFWNPPSTHNSGKIVDLNALAHACGKDGHLIGAAVDVFPMEPSKNGVG